MYCLYVGVDYTYVYVNALAQGIKSFFAPQVWFQAVGMAPIRPQLLVSHAKHSATETSLCMYLCMYECMYIRTYIRMYACMYVCMYACMHVYMYVCITFLR